MLNADMGFYHLFNSKPNGTAPGKYCPQLKNLTTLFNCSTKDPSYMPLSHNAQQAFNYVKNLTLYYYDLYKAFNALTSVPSEFDNSANFVRFYPSWVCNGTQPICMGDVWMQACAGYSIPTC
jgi:hypothetical protein